MNRNFTKSFRRKSSRAFSLIELSIILAIVSIITVALVSLSGSRSINDKVKSGNDNIAKIYQALGSYLKANKSLPCPASLKEIKSSSTTYGTSASGTNCVGTGVYQSTTNTNLVYGMVPTKTLGLSGENAEDAYGNKIVYVVDSRLTTTTDDSFENNVSNSNLISITGNISISNALFVVISRGANSSGAFPANSATPIAASSDSNELLNDASSYIDNTPPVASTANFAGSFVNFSNASTFDDVVFYKTQEQMFGEFDAWNLVPCLSSTSIESIYETSITWPKAYQNQIVTANNLCPTNWQGGLMYPTKKCGSKGVWGSIIGECSSSSSTPLSCSISRTGISTTSVSNRSGSLSCDQTGYSGSVTYTCNSYSGGSATITGNCTIQPCTGGDVIDSTTVAGSYIHIFSTVGTNTLYCPSSRNARVLVVGGGGGGGGSSSIDAYGNGGGGGGGMIHNANFLISTGNTTVTVGAGGNSSTTSGSNGGNSIFSTITAYGGGGGGGRALIGLNGGSGGGGGITSSAKAGGVGTSGQGNNGGTGQYSGGGGGGAGEPGGNGSTGTASVKGGNGGIGLQNDITGSFPYYSGGGGGSYWTGGGGTPSHGLGTSTTGGGGAPGSAGLPNTGGGGGSAINFQTSGYAGGSGIVVVRYSLDLYCSVSKAGVGTTSVSTASGSLSCNQTGYSGSVNYTCNSTSGEPATIIGNCTLQPCTGGTIVTSDHYIKHTFSTVGSSPFQCPSSRTVEALVVGGGGGGGGGISKANQVIGAGGGGGGGLVYNSNFSVSTSPITITVGDGGAGSGTLDLNTYTLGVNGTTGTSSVFSSLVAPGGGGGGGARVTGSSGGSGGGGGGKDAGTAAGTGTSGKGYAGANGNGSGGGGGGGASIAGSSATGGPTTGGSGGSGVQVTFNGSSAYYGGGGGGSFTYNAALPCSTCRGGNGGTGGGGGYGNPGTNGTGGGGGGSYYSAGSAGNKGGSGIVIIGYSY